MNTLAQIINPVIREDLQKLTGTQFLAGFLPLLITLALVIASIVFLFVMILGGVAWMTAGGDKAKVEAAQSQLTNGIIGLFIVFVIFALAQVLEILLGIDILTIDIGQIILQ